MQIAVEFIDFAEQPYFLQKESSPLGKWATFEALLAQAAWKSYLEQ